MNPKPGDLVQVIPSFPVFGGKEGIVLWVVEGPFGYPYAVLVEGEVVRFQPGHLIRLQPSLPGL